MLYASDIVERRKEYINMKKEYFFRPKGPIGSSFLTSDPMTIRERENIKIQIGQKLKRLDASTRKHTLLAIRLAVLERLIARNKSSSVMQVTTIDLTKPVSLKMNNLQGTLDKLSRGTSRSSRGDEKSPMNVIPVQSGPRPIGKSVSYVPSSGEQGRIKIPCWFCPSVGKNIKLEKQNVDLQTTRYWIQSSSPQIVYQDFELIGTLWNWNQSPYGPGGKKSN